MELTILMPCLNEAASIPFCIGEAQAFLSRSGTAGEILLADNGSTDGSRQLAEALGARVEPVAERGYGAALRAGILAAKGRYVIMADCDGSYDLLNLEPFLEQLRRGAQLVVGDRYGLGFAPGASPWLHRAVGVPVLSWLGRCVQRKWKPQTLIRDFHCGLRGVEREAFLSLQARCSGMEFASEMILRATAAGQIIRQLPTGLRPDLRGGRPPHLRAFRDGMRHVRTIFRLRRLMD